MTDSDHDAAARPLSEQVQIAIHQAFEEVIGYVPYSKRMAFLKCLSAAGFSIARTPEVGVVTIPLDLASHVRTAVRAMATYQAGGRYWLDIERSLEDAIARTIVRDAAIARVEEETGG